MKKRYQGQFQPGHNESSINIVRLLKACSTTKDLHQGSKLHAYIREHKCFENNRYIGSTLVSMYAKCGALAKAQQVLKELSVHDVVSWNALIAGYAQQGHAEEALKCFDSMLRDGHSPNAVTFTCVLKACGSILAAAKGEEIHGQIVSMRMLEKDIVLGNSLVDMYVKCGALAKAQQVLEELPARNEVSWNALIAGYAQNGKGQEALKCFDDMLNEGHPPDAVTFACVLKACANIGAATKGEEIHDQIANLGLLGKDAVLGNTLVDMYIKCGALTKAKHVLEELSTRNVVSWSALIAGYAQQGQGKEALKCFDDMLQEGHSPDAITFACVLKACGSIGAIAKGKEIHDKIINLDMLEKNIMLGTTLMEMYLKCGALIYAQQALEELPSRDAISWSALIAGYADQEQAEKVLKCFDDMLCEGHSPFAVTFIYALKACGSIGAAAKGEEIHAKIVGFGMLEKDLVLGNSLVDMYAKCGALAKAQEVLEELPVCDAISWSVLISGYAQQGQSFEALNCFERMQLTGVKPDLLNLTTVLNACSHSGLLDWAETYFSGMSMKYGIHPSLEHYYCMTGVFGRAGKFDKALSMIAEMPHDKCLPSWVALLGACCKWAEMKIGRLAFKHAVHLDKRNSAAYVFMADIYTAAGMQEEADKVEVLGVGK